MSNEPGIDIATIRCVPLGAGVPFAPTAILHVDVSNYTIDAIDDLIEKFAETLLVARLGLPPGMLLPELLKRIARTVAARLKG